MTGPRRLLLASLLCLGCDRPARTDMRWRQAAPEAIYGILVDSLRGSGQPVYVVRTTHAPGHMPDSTAAERARRHAWLQSEDRHLTPDLLAALDSALARPMPLPAAVGQLPGIRLIDSTYAGVPRDGNGLPIGRQLSFSPIGFSADSTRAIVYAGMQCGVLCGVGAYYVLTRRPDGRWQVVGRVVTVIS